MSNSSYLIWICFDNSREVKLFFYISHKIKVSLFFRTKTTFNDAIVFVVGGGNYIEYQNLRDYVKGRNTGNFVNLSFS